MMVFLWSSRACPESDKVHHRESSINSDSASISESHKVLLHLRRPTTVYKPKTATENQRQMQSDDMCCSAGGDRLVINDEEEHILTFVQQNVKILLLTVSLEE